MSLHVQSWAPGLTETWKQPLTCLSSPATPARRTVHYYAELGQCSVFTATAAPEQFISQVTVLKYFSHYMEENLMDVGAGCRTGAGRGSGRVTVCPRGCGGQRGGRGRDPGPPGIFLREAAASGNEWSAHCISQAPSNLFQGGDLPSVTDTCRPRLYLLQWLKSDKALMMLFNDGTFQVSSLGKGRCRS